MARKKKTADMDVPMSAGTGESPTPNTADKAPLPADERLVVTDVSVQDTIDAAAIQSEPVEEGATAGESAAEAAQLPADNAAEPSELKLVPAHEEPDGDAPDEPAESDGHDEPQFIDPGAPEITTQQVIEAILFTADTPLTLPKIVSLLGVGSARDVKKHIENLNKRYVSEGATFRIEKIAGGYQMLTLPQFNTWLRRLRQSRQDSRFSAAALETLSVVAYKQPVTRADIEAIRGVAAGEMLNRLRELNLVKIVGRAEDVGRPMLYGTTKRFLEVFGLASLDELPQVEQLQIAQ